MQTGPQGGHKEECGGGWERLGTGHALGGISCRNVPDKNPVPGTQGAGGGDRSWGPRASLAGQWVECNSSPALTLTAADNDSTGFIFSSNLTFSFFFPSPQTIVGGGDGVQRAPSHWLKEDCLESQKTMHKM